MNILLVFVLINREVDHDYDQRLPVTLSAEN